MEPREDKEFVMLLLSVRTWKQRIEDLNAIIEYNEKRIRELVKEFGNTCDQAIKLSGENAKYKKELSEVTNKLGFQNALLAQKKQKYGIYERDR